MNDRELLEMAAKAAGMSLKYAECFGEAFMHDGEPDGVCWNPLTDEGDALRLAIKLGMRIEVDNAWNRSHAQQIPKGEWSTAPHNTDPYLATRRAIVSAAAEIGKAMP